jgi:DNA-binding PadR family transcriptional regulator
MASERAVRPEEHLPLHPLEFQILLALVEGESHAYAVVRAIEERQPSWSRIHPTNLYRRIWRLESKGLIELSRGPGPDDSRKHFAITPLGRRVAAAETVRLRALLAEAARVGIAGAASGRTGR